MYFKLWHNKPHKCHGTTLQMNQIWIIFFPITHQHQSSHMKQQQVDHLSMKWHAKRIKYPPAGLPRCKLRDLSTHSAVVGVPVVGVLVEAAPAGEDDERHLGVAEDGELVSLLEEPVATLAEGDLPARVVLDPLDLNPSPPHAGDLGWKSASFHMYESADSDRLKRIYRDSWEELKDPTDVER